MSIKRAILNIPNNYWKILYWLVALILCWIESYGRSDFTIYRLASKDLIQGICPYSHSYIDGYYYYYSLLFAYLIYPFTLLNEFTSTFLWLFVNAGWLYLIMVEINSFLDWKGLFREKKMIFWALLVLFSIRTVRENFHSAQVTILMLFLMLYSLKFVRTEKDILAGLFLAFAINIKLLALPVLVYYTYRGYWKTVSWTMLFLILMYGIPLLVMGWDFYASCMQEWWALVNPSNDKHLIDVEERSFHSITTLISTLFLKNPPDIYALPIRRYIVDLSVEQVKWIIQFVRMLLMMSVLLVIKELPFRKVKSPSQLFFEFSYVLALVPLLFPHQQHYAFLLQMPAIAMLIYQCVSGRLKTLEKVLLVIIFLCFNLKIILGIWNEYYEHFKILSYGALIVLVLLINVKLKGLRS